MLERTAYVGVGCFIVGWALVFISGHGGNSTGGSEAVWRIGGIMVYAAFVLLVLVVLATLVVALWSGMNKLRHRI